MPTQDINGYDGCLVKLVNGFERPKPQSPLPPQLPRHRSALHDARDLATELSVNDRPLRDTRELVGLFDNGELAAR